MSERRFEDTWTIPDKLPPGTELVQFERDESDDWQDDCPFCDGDGCEECDETGEY